MKLAILLPGYLDSPNYPHFNVFEERLHLLGYMVVRLDPCSLWRRGDASKYSVTNYLNDVRKALDEHLDQNHEEIILIGHSLGGFISIIAGSRFPEITKVIALCPPANFDKSSKKWKGKEFRVSRRYLPKEQSRFREFKIPISYSLDSQKYSAVEEVKQLKKPLMIFIGLEDTVVAPEVTEKIITSAINPYVVRKKGIGHDFRNSEEQSKIVMDEIEKFLLLSL